MFEAVCIKTGRVLASSHCCWWWQSCTRKEAARRFREVFKLTHFRVR